jgi:hypothetical protein
MLLLPAPLLIGNERWAAPKSIKSSVSAIVKLVTAFTLGHSLTLILGAARAPVLPARAVEVLIAGSIVISAVHALQGTAAISFRRRRCEADARLGALHER